MFRHHWSESMSTNHLGDCPHMLSEKRSAGSSSLKGLTCHIRHPISSEGGGPSFVHLICTESPHCSTVQFLCKHKTKLCFCRASSHCRGRTEKMKHLRKKNIHVTKQKLRLYCVSKNVFWFKL